MKKRIIIRKPAEGKDNASRGQQSGFSAQAEDNYDASRGENCEEIDNASRDEQSVFPPRAKENDNESQKPQEIFKDWPPYSRPRSPDKTNKKDIDGPVLSLDRGCPPEKKKVQRRLWSNDNETESNYEQIGSIIDDQEWLEALRFRLDQSEEERRNRNQDGKEENDSALEESEEKKERRREILEVLAKRQEHKDLAKGLLSLEPCSEENINWIVDNLYGLKSDDGLLTFEQKMPGRMFDGNRWKRTDVGFKTGGISQSYEAKKPRAITHRSHSDENRHQSSASNPRNRGEEPISRPSKEKYSYLPHFHEEFGNFKAGHFGDIEQVEGFLVGGREKLQEIRRELGSHSRARSPDENHEREVVDDSVIFLHSELSSDSRSRSRSPANIHGKEVIDGSVSSPGYSPSPQKKKLFTLWGVDIYEEDVGNRPEDVEPSKPMRGSTDDQDA